MSELHRGIITGDETGIFGTMVNWLHFFAPYALSRLYVNCRNIINITTLCLALKFGFASIRMFFFSENFCVGNLVQIQQFYSKALFGHEFSDNFNSYNFKNFRTLLPLLKCELL